MTTDTSSSLSPLERAKALLQQTQKNASSSIASESSEKVETSLSPLERAKALLQQTQTPASESPSTHESTPAEQVSTPELSPLERAKALLQQTQETPSSTQSKPKELSPLEKAKALLQQSQKESKEKSSDDESQSLNHLLQATENMVSQLQAHVDQAKEDDSSTSNDIDPNSPEQILCNQGEELFIGGHADQAKTIFESALRINPDCLRALNNLGVLALHNERPYEALSLFLLGLIQNTQDQDILQNLAALFEQNPHLSLYKYLVFDA